MCLKKHEVYQLVYAVNR